jgi:hypothetical protein
MIGRISPFRKQILRYYGFLLDGLNKTLADILMRADSDNELTRAIRTLSQNGVILPGLFINVPRLTIIEKHQIELVKKGKVIEEIKVIPKVEQNKRIEEMYGITIKEIRIPISQGRRIFILDKSQVEFGVFIEFGTTIQFILVVSNIIIPS